MPTASRAQYSLSLVAALAWGAVAVGGCGLGVGICDDLERRPSGACPDSVQNPGQQLRDFREPTQMARPPVGTPVDVRNVVISAIDDYAEGGTGRTGTVWVQQLVTDPAFMGCVPSPQGRVCGIQVFGPTFVPTGAHGLVGDLVNVTGGSYDEFPGPSSGLFSDGRTLPELSQVVLERIGTTRPPDPVPVTLAQIAMGGDAYVGVLVRVTDDVVTMAPNRRGEIPLDQGVNIATDLSPITDPMTNMPIAAGTHLHNLTGIVTYFYGPKILPRSPAELGIVR